MKMNKVTYLSGWNKDLCFIMDVSHNRYCDFNRLFYKGVPSTKNLRKKNTFKPANRDNFIFQLKEEYEQKKEEGVSDSTLYHLFYSITNYIKWCDSECINPFNKNSIESHFQYLFEQVRLGDLKNTSYNRKRSNLLVIFRDYLDLPANWFRDIPSVGRDQLEPFEAYTRSDLNQLLPFLRQLFNQTSKQFLKNPKKHIEAHNNVKTMIFHWKEKDYKLCGTVSKMMCAATFLMSYYTYLNTGTLLKLKRPNNASISIGELWYTMPAFKRRSFKTITIEMGEHGFLDIPKYCITFFDTLLKVSKTLDNSNNALLLQTIAYKNIHPLTGTTLEDFNRRWLQVHFPFIDQQGRRLRPTISRFRETGAQITTAYQGELANNITLDNTPHIRKRHYSTGNKHTNNAIMQDVASIRQEQAITKLSATEAQISLGIEVLTIEEENRTNFPQLSRTPNGGSCANPFGEKSKAYNRKAKQRNLLKDGEKLACADLLKCFGCPEQVIVQSVSDIWCLLSFKECIKESLYLHLNAHHYRQNFEKTIIFITENIIPKLKKNILKQAKVMLNDKGLHPHWDDAESIIAMIPKTHSKMPKELN